MALGRGRAARAAAIAAELGRLDVAVIVAEYTMAVRAAMRATTAIPIVMAPAGDPVAAGLVASLARPGGNVTGLTFFSSELVAKRFEILKSAMPEAKRIGVMVNPDNPIQGAPLAKSLERVGTSLKVQVDSVPARSLAELGAGRGEPRPRGGAETDLEACGEEFGGGHRGARLSPTNDAGRSQ